MDWLAPWFLTAHVIGVMLAFGPTYAYSIYGGMVGREPMHANFMNRAQFALSQRLLLPATLSLAVSGVGLIWSNAIDVFDPEYRWLLVGIAIYAVAVLYNQFVLGPLNARIRAIGAELAAARAAAAAAGPSAVDPSAAASVTAGPAGSPPAGSPPAGPPPELAALVKRTRRDGKALGVVVLVIIFIMVLQPTYP
jgi:hypothetical protein